MTSMNVIGKKPILKSIEISAVNNVYDNVDYYDFTFFSCLVD